MEERKKKNTGRSFGQRLKLFHILDYMLENTDDEHTVKAAEIIAHLHNKFEISAEEKTIYSDLRLLDEYGYSTEYDGRSRGWRVLDREFDLSELQLLIDSVQASRFITQKQAKVLTDKLKKKASRFARPLLDRRCYVQNRTRSSNNSIIYSLDDIHAAIANNWQIKFKYFYFTPKKKKEFYKKGEHYIASPYALLWSNNNYYLLAFESGKMKHFRVDKLDSLEIVFEKREGIDVFKKMKLSERSTQIFSMYSGEVKHVKMRFSNHLANAVIDRFGEDIDMINDDGRHFIIRTDIEVSPQFFGWLCGLGRAAKILGPEDVIEEMREHVNKIADMY